MLVSKLAWKVIATLTDICNMIAILPMMIVAEVEIHILVEKEIVVTTLTEIKIGIIADQMTVTFLEIGI